MPEQKKFPSKFSSFVQCKCPRCREGDVYVNKITSWDGYRMMYETCTVCGLRYELEVGFFWGAMYVGYGMNVALSVTLGVATYVLFGNPDVWAYMTAIISGIALTYRYNFRYSRMMLLNMFAPKFDSRNIEKRGKEKIDPNLN